MSTPVLVFTIPGNPGDGKVNHAYTTQMCYPKRKKGAKGPAKKVPRRIPSEKGKAFAARAKAAVLEAWTRPTGWTTFERLRVEIHVYTDRQHRELKNAATKATCKVTGEPLPLIDVDSCIKATLDSLKKAGVIADDTLITDLERVGKHYDKANPRIEVTVWLARTARPTRVCDYPPYLEMALRHHGFSSSDDAPPEAAFAARCAMLGVAGLADTLIEALDDAREVRARTAPGSTQDNTGPHKEGKGVAE